MKTFATTFFSRQGFYVSTFESEAKDLAEAKKLNTRKLFEERKEQTNDDCADGEEESDEKIAEGLEESEWYEVVTFEVVGKYEDYGLDGEIGADEFLKSLVD